MTISAVALFAYLRIVLQFFYAPLGVTPDEVGYSYVTTLEQSVVLLALALLSLALVGTLAFLAVFSLSLVLVPVLMLVLSAEAGIWLVRRGLALVRRRPRPDVTQGAVSAPERSPRDPFPVPALLKRTAKRAGRLSWNLAPVVIGAFVLWIVALLVVLPFYADHQGHLVEAGQVDIESSDPLFEGTLAGAFPLALQPFRAETAVVHWSPVGSASPRGLPPDGSCAYYLGESDGVEVLYAPAHGGEVFRVDAAEISLETGPVAYNNCPYPY